jgi:hypothetical protein
MNIPDDALQALLRPALAERAGLTRSGRYIWHCGMLSVVER